MKAENAMSCCTDDLHWNADDGASSGMANTIFGDDLSACRNVTIEVMRCRASTGSVPGHLPLT